MDPNEISDSTSNHSSVYHAFLLRIWRTEPWMWQASLQDAKGGQRLGFDSLEALFAYLMGMTDGRAGDGDGKRDGA